MPSKQISAKVSPVHTHLDVTSINLFKDIKKREQKKKMVRISYLIVAYLTLEYYARTLLKEKESDSGRDWRCH